jgi:hypothetical protein
MSSALAGRALAGGKAVEIVGRDPDTGQLPMAPALENAIPCS